MLVLYIHIYTYKYTYRGVETCSECRQGMQGVGFTLPPYLKPATELIVALSRKINTAASLAWEHFCSININEYLWGEKKIYKGKKKEGGEGQRRVD